MSRPKEIYEGLRAAERINTELWYARIWDDTKKDISWLQQLPGISPGRMAVGYNYIYVMTRILNEMHPSKVLDLGLGISSTLISSYFNSLDRNPDAVHTIIEHDSDWIDFYTRNRSLSSKSRIMHMPCITKEYNGCKFDAYDGFKESLSGFKYSVISVDAPLGSDDKYSRRDILDIIPQCLDEDFVIVFDDVNRTGEKNTITDIESCLKTNGIVYYKAIYFGLTDICVIASKNNRFFCSL